MDLDFKLPKDMTPEQQRVREGTLQVVDPTNLLRSAASMCGPLQFVRELTHNAIQARIRGKPNKVYIGPDWIYVKDSLKKHGKAIYRFCCEDNGVGMDEDGLILFGKIAASFAKFGGSYNLGIGAKISSLWRSPSGLLVISYQNGKGRMIRIYLNNHGVPVIERHFVGLDEYGQEIHQSVQDAPKEYDYDFAGVRRDHGTLVILLGSEDHPNSFYDIKGVKWGIYTYFDYLSQERYFEIPKDVTVKTWVPNNADVNLWPTTFPGYQSGREANQCSCREVVGAAYYFSEDHFKLKKVMLDGNKMPTPTFTRVEGKLAYYWTWTLAKKIDPGQNMAVPFGFYGVLNGLPGSFNTDPPDWSNREPGEQEIYEKDRHPNRFVTFGFKHKDSRERVILLIEPKDPKILPDPSRTYLNHQDVGTLPWHEWANEYRELNPSNAAQLNKECTPKDMSTEELINDELDKLWEDMGLLSKGGVTRRKAPTKNGKKREESENPRHSPTPNRPRMEWILGPTDFPVQYIPGLKPVITIFGDHFLVTTKIQRYLNIYKGNIALDPTLEVQITQVCQRVFVRHIGSSLVAAVKLRGVGVWDDASMVKLLCLEALTHTSTSILIDDAIQAKLLRPWLGKPLETEDTED